MAEVTLKELADIVAALAERVTTNATLLTQYRQQIDWITADLRSHRGGYSVLSPQPSGW